MKNITAKQLNEICKAHDFILARFPNGYKMGINCKVANLQSVKKRYNPKNITSFVSYKPCGILEYIQHKHPFIT